MKKIFMAFVFAVLFLTGCVNSTINTATGKKVQTLALTKAEQIQLADEMVDNMMVYVNQGRLFANPNGHYVLGIGSLDNKTTNVPNLDSFEDRVKELMMEKLGTRLTINDNLRADGNVDVMQDALKEARGNADYDQSKVIKQGGLQTFTQVLRTYLKDEYVPLNGNKVEVTYELNMRINDAYTGTTMWSKTTRITKEGSRKDLKW